MIRGFDLDLLATSREIESVLSSSRGEYYHHSCISLKRFGDAIGAETVSEAFQVWHACEEIRRLLAIKYRERAEVAYWFGLNPFELEDSQVLALKDATQKMLCQERIQRGEYDPLDHEGIYRMFLQAYGDEKLARKRQSESFKLYVEKVTRANR